jgi:phage terminase large subunit GpA-like protein
MGGLLVTAGVDTQDNRLEVVLWAYGKDGQQWAIDYHVFYGDPSSPALWDELDEYLQKELHHESGEAIKISAAAVDTGGHHTQRVYDFCRTRRYRHIIAIKGSSTRNKPVISKPANVDVTFSGKTLKDGVQLWPVGTDTAKEVIYGKFNIKAGAGSMHFSHELPDEFYEQISSEKLITRYHKGFPRKEWVKPSHVRNEVLDCSVYSLAAAYHLGMNKFSQRDWKTLEDTVQPLTKDLFADKTENIKQIVEAKSKKTQQNYQPIARRKKANTGFASRW